MHRLATIHNVTNDIQTDEVWFS